MKQTEDAMEVDAEWLKLVAEAKRIGFTPHHMRTLLHQVGETAISPKHSTTNLNQQEITASQ